MDIDLLLYDNCDKYKFTFLYHKSVTLIGYPPVFKRFKITNLWHIWCNVELKINLINLITPQIIIWHVLLVKLFVLQQAVLL